MSNAIRFVLLVSIMLIGISTATAQSKSELLDEIEEHVIDPCIRIAFGEHLKQGEYTEQEVLRAAKSMMSDALDAVRDELLPVMQQVPGEDDRIKGYAAYVILYCPPPE